MSGLLWRVLAALAGIAAIWAPEFSHYSVRRQEISGAVVDRLRSAPVNELLSDLAAVEFEPRQVVTDIAQVTVAADSILRGYWADPEFGPRSFSLPFASEDLQSGLPTEQLRFASLGHVEVLLDAFDATGERRFLEGARDIVNAWSGYERRRHLSIGFLWNDHAVAHRVLVLTRYWAAFRSSPLYDDASGRLLVEFIHRSALMLEKPSHFTVRTNHGVMQNLALLHVATAFPALPDAGRFRSVAIGRLRQQLPFYQSEEGAILEHSAGYHLLGVNLLAALAKYERLSATDYGLDVRGRLDRACDFLHVLLQPDGTLPLIGNTKAAIADVRSCAAPNDVATSSSGASGGMQVFPISGYLAMAGGDVGHKAPAERASRAFVHWGNFRSGAHKHDDEMAITTWIDGRRFLTGVGYWPYGHPLQEMATGWRGSNAPHFDHDAPRNERHTELLAWGSSEVITAAELQRVLLRTRDTIRRQIIQVDAGLLIVLDLAESQENKQFSTVWTVYPDWDVAEFPQGSGYRFSSKQSVREMVVSFSDGPDTERRLLKASREPFGGWVALDMTPLAIRESTSIDVRAAVGVPFVSVWAAGHPTDSPLQARVTMWKGPEDWRLCLSREPCQIGLARHGRRIEVSRSGAADFLQLRRSGDARPEIHAIDNAYIEAARAFPFWRDYHAWREVATRLLLAAFALQEVLLACWRRWGERHAPANLARVVIALRRALPVLWLAGGAYVAFFYFK